MRLGIEGCRPNVRPAMGFSGRQIDEQSGRRLGARVGGANSVPSEHAVRNVVFIYRVGDQVFSNVCGFTRCDYPVDDIAVEYIEDRIEVTAISFDRILEPGWAAGASRSRIGALYEFFGSSECPCSPSWRRPLSPEIYR